MKPLSLVALCCATLTTGAVTGQTVVVFPGDHTDQASVAGQRSIEGSTYSNRFPFSYGVSRCQLAIDDWDLPIPAGRQITKVGVTRDGSRTSSGTQIELEIIMGQPTVSLSQVGNNFANNYAGGVPTTVFNKQIFQLPDLGGALGVEEFFILLDTPYSFDGSRILITEFVVTATAPGNQAFNYYIDRGAALVGQRSYGVGCSSGSTLPTIRSTATKIGANWSLQARNLIASASAIWLVGIQSFEPGVPLDAFGFTNCFALVNPVIAVSGYTTSTSGALNLTFAIPSQLSLVGGQLYSQVAAGNVFGLSITDGDEMTVTTDPLGVAVYASGPGSATASTGSVSRNYGLITYFEHN
jgi:hypothetical protein